MLHSPDTETLRLPADVTAALDRMVEAGRFASREEALAATVRCFVDEDGRDRPAREGRQEAESRLRRFADHLPNGFLFQVAAEADGRGRRFLYLSSGAERLLGIAITDALRDAGLVYGLIPAEYRAAMAEAEARVLATHSVFHVEVPMQVGSELRWFQISSAPHREDDAVVWNGVALEISEAKRTQDLLRYTNEDLRQRVAERTEQLRVSEATALTLYNRSPVPQHSVAADGRYLTVSDGWLEMMGYTREEVIGRPFYDFLPEHWRERLQEAMKLLAERGEVRDFEYELIAKDGTLRPISVTTRVEYDEAGNWVRTYGVTMDLRERKAAEAALAKEAEERRRAEEALQQAQKMQALGQLTGGIAHDFNNLLTIIRGGVDMLARPNLAPARKERYLAGIIQATDRAASLTNQLLAFARKQPLRPEAIDVRERILGMAEVLRRTLGARYRIDTAIDPETWPVRADPTQLEIAIINIGVNARDAMPDGGLLEIRTENVVLPARASRPAGDYVRITLTDTGTGISPEHIQHVFEPFYTTKEVGKGTGLGLSQVYGFAAQSGGDILLESELGRGTSLILHLPRSQADVEAVRDKPEGAVQELRKGRVLLVEDNVEVGEFAQHLLEELGYEVIRVEAATAALEALHSGAEVDVVFSDIVMPGMSGLELARTVRQVYPAVPIILTTGYSEHHSRSDFPDIPLLPKPYRLETLAATLNEALSARPAS